MSSALKANNPHAFGGSTLNSSRLLSGLTIGGALFLILLAGVEVIIEMPQVAQLFRLPEEIIIHEPPKKKKFEILFDNDTDFIYMLEVKKPVIEPPKVEPKPEPPKPKPKPPPKPAAKPQEAPKEAPVAEQEQQGAVSEGSGGASGDQVLAELLYLVNKYKVYPRAAQKRGIEGINYITVNVDASGRISAASLAKAMGNSTLDNASKKLAEKLISLKVAAPNKILKVNVPIQYTFKD